MQVEAPAGLAQTVLGQLIAQQQVSDAFERVFGELHRAGQASRDLQVTLWGWNGCKTARAVSSAAAVPCRCATRSWTRRPWSSALRAPPCTVATTSCSTAPPASSRSVHGRLSHVVSRACCTVAHPDA